MRLGDVGIDGERGVGRSVAVIDVAAINIAKVGLRDAEQGPDLSVIGVDLHGAAANAQHALLAADVAMVAGDPILPREQIKLVSLDVGCAALLDRSLFFREKLDL